MQDGRYHRDLEAEVPGGSIAGWRVGTGPAVLLLHGGPGLSDYTLAWLLSGPGISPAPRTPPDAAAAHIR
jgi:hypothetical protein